MEKHTLLIIDDDVDICMLLKRFFERKGYRVRIAFKASEGIDIVKKESIDLVLTDFRLPDKDGFDVIKEIQAVKKNLPVIVITGYSDVNQAVQAIRLGAYEYVTKPIYPEEILLLVEEAIAKSKRKESDKKLAKGKKKGKQSSTDKYLIPSGAYAEELQRQISLVSPTDMTVIIIGESGTGKEVVARMIHEASDRKDQAFIPVDCGALTQELASSELFGHVRGAFTGAASDKKGSFELANNGTLFLDEIGNLSYENQIKLLRALQEKVIRKVGGEKEIPIDVRIIVATNEDLEKAIEKGTFRTDIYYRINEFKISLKPLRENKEELEQFFDFFLNQSNKELNKSVKGIEPDAWKLLLDYPWPGNTRELKNVVKYSVLMTEGDTIKTESLPTEILNFDLASFIQLDSNDEGSLDLREVSARAETKAILQALKLTKNNRSRAAELLGIDRKTLYNKMNAYGLMEE